MNKVQLLGRLTRDVELKTTASGVSVCSFTIAVNRRFKNPQGEYEADFINCVAWRQGAELLAKYFGKGSMVGLVGSIQTRSYDNKDGQRVYVTEVSVEEVHFVESRKTEAVESRSNEGYIPMPEPGMFPVMPGDDDLPF